MSFYFSDQVRTMLHRRHHLHQRKEKKDRLEMDQVEGVAGVEEDDKRKRYRHILYLNRGQWNDQEDVSIDTIDI